MEGTGSHEKGDKGSRLYQWYDCLRKSPPMLLILIGVILPLFVLLLISLLFGYFLSLLEEDEEVEFNNNLLAIAEQNALMSSLFSNLTILAPRICFHHYVLNNGTTLTTLVELVGENPEQILETALAGEFTQDAYQNLSTDDDDQLLNAKDSYSFLVQCQNAMLEEAQQLGGSLAVQISSVELVTPALTFNWIRCTPFHGDVSWQTNLTYEESIRPVSWVSSKRIRLWLIFAHPYRWITTFHSYSRSLSKSILPKCGRASFLGWRRIITSYTWVRIGRTHAPTLSNKRSAKPRGRGRAT